MCLISNTKTIRRSVVKRTCYKVVLKHQTRGYITPFIQKAIPQEAINGEVPFVAEGKVRKFFNEIYSGVIHCYFSSTDAKDLARRLHVGGCEAEVYECSIDEGVKFYEGKDYDNLFVCAAKQIRFIRKLELNQ